MFINYLVVTGCTLALFFADFEAIIKRNTRWINMCFVGVFWIVRLSIYTSYCNRLANPFFSFLAMYTLELLFLVVVKTGAFMLKRKMTPQEIIEFGAFSEQMWSCYFFFGAAISNVLSICVKQNAFTKFLNNLLGWSQLASGFKKMGRKNETKK